MSYILIFIVLNSSGGAITSGHIEFSRKEQCLIAANEMARQYHKKEKKSFEVLTCVPNRGVK